MSKHFLNSRPLLPLLIVVGVLILGIRIGDVWDAAIAGKIFTSSPALAEGNSEATDTKAEAPAPAPAAPDGSKAANAKPTSEDNGTSPPEDVGNDDDSPAEMEVLKQLSERHHQLDTRAHDLDTREALIKVAEQRVDQKIKEMESLRLQLQAMVNQAGAAQQAQIDNLVKIYETMKPQDAAKIFEALDMPVLLDVIQKMKPARTAPILAAMAPQKAKEVTVALTKQDQLPQTK